MSILECHAVTDAVTDTVPNGVTPHGQNAFRTPSVTLLQTRPDQTRVFSTSACGHWNHRIRNVAVCRGISDSEIQR